MEEKLKGNRDWVHILLKGEKSPNSKNPSNDEYVQEFKSNNLCAFHVPILEFEYKNLDRLGKQIEDTRKPYGLIITSPRVVTSLREAMNSIEVNVPLRDLNEDHVFVVGERTARDWERLMKMRFNKLSSETGNANELAKFINKQYFGDKITLIYPKSSLANNSVEEILEQNDRISLAALEVYETRVINNIAGELLAVLSSNLTEVSDKTTLNLVMFSPSGVEGISRIDWGNFENQLMDLIGHRVNIQFSSIGETTAAALRSKSLPVFTVASKPTAKSLVESILKCDKR